MTGRRSASWLRNLCIGLLVFSLAGPSSADGSPADESAAILRTILNHPAAPHAQCVVGELSGPALAEAREEHRGALRQAKARRATPAQLAKNRAMLATIYADWRRPAKQESGEAPAKLAAAEAAPVAAAALDLLDQPLSGPVLDKLDPSWLPPGSRLVWEKQSCETMLTLSAPAIMGDIAFVETAFFCGALCGDGAIHALRRHGGQWEWLGSRGTWIS